MEMPMLVWLFGWVLVVCLCNFRNVQVFKYRMKLTEAVYQRNIKTIDAGESYAMCQHRWDELEQVSYQRMFLVFWRPLDRFYDQEFLKEIGVI